MISHVQETKMLWDRCDPAMQIAPTTDNQGEPTEQLLDPHELSELCPKCLENFIGRDGCCSDPVC